MSRRSLTRADRRLWGRVERTLDKTRVRPPEPDDAEELAPAAKAPPRFVKPDKPKPVVAPPKPPPSAAHAAPHELEPRRHRRLARERDPIEARIDLHGLSRFQAQDARTAFLMNAQARGYRAVLVVTGKGSRGTPGVIRSSVADWIAHPPLRAVVAGVAGAHRRHGGDGALYITLRRPV